MGDETAGRPVLVDPTGRRGRLLARVFWAAATFMTAYVVLVVVSLAGTPGLSRLRIPGIGPVLPGPAAAQLANGTGGHARPARLLSTSRATAGPSDAASALPVSTPSAVVAPASSAGTPAARSTAGTAAASSPSAAAPASPTALATPTPASPQPTATPAQATVRPTPRSSRTPNPHATKGAV